MKDSLNLYKYIDDFTRYTNLYVANTIPCVNRDIRIHLLDEIYNLRKNVMYSFCTKGNVRIKHLIDTKVNLLMVDSLLSDIREFKCCKTNRLDVSIDKLTSIKNIIYGWIVNEEKGK